MHSNRLVPATRWVVAVATVAAAVLLLATSNVVPAVGVGVAGALLVAFLVVVERRIIPARQSSLTVAERRHNLAVVRVIGHGLTALGLVLTATGGVLTLTGTGSDDLAHLLLVWMGPYAVAGGLGMYTGNRVAQRLLAAEAPPQ